MSAVSVTAVCWMMLACLACLVTPENQGGDILGCEQIVTKKLRDMARGNTERVLNPDLLVPQPSHLVILLTHSGWVIL